MFSQAFCMWKGKQADGKHVAYYFGQGDSLRLRLCALLLVSSLLGSPATILGRLLLLEAAPPEQESSRSGAKRCAFCRRKGSFDNSWQNDESDWACLLTTQRWAGSKEDREGRGGGKQAESHAYSKVNLSNTHRLSRLTFSKGSTQVRLGPPTRQPSLSMDLHPGKCV